VSGPPPSWVGLYVVAVERLDYFADRHALPRPDRLPVDGWEPSMCGKPVFPLTAYAGSLLEFWPDEGACRACVAAITRAHAAPPIETDERGSGAEEES
jgi:hypothetical protein